MGVIGLQMRWRRVTKREVVTGRFRKVESCSKVEPRERKLGEIRTLPGQKKVDII